DAVHGAMDRPFALIKVSMHMAHQQRGCCATHGNTCHTEDGPSRGTLPEYEICTPFTTSLPRIASCYLRPIHIWGNRFEPLLPWKLHKKHQPRNDPSLLTCPTEATQDPSLLALFSSSLSLPFTR